MSGRRMHWVTFGRHILNPPRESPMCVVLPMSLQTSLSLEVGCVCKWRCRLCVQMEVHPRTWPSTTPLRPPLIPQPPWRTKILVLQPWLPLYFWSNKLSLNVTKTKLLFLSTRNIDETALHPLGHSSYLPYCFSLSSHHIVLTGAHKVSLQPEN